MGWRQAPAARCGGQRPKDSVADASGFGGSRLAFDPLRQQEKLDRRDPADAGRVASNSLCCSHHGLHRS
jgi:hypothetical protein